MRLINTLTAPMDLNYIPGPASVISATSLYLIAGRVRDIANELRQIREHLTKIQGTREPEPRQPRPGLPQ